MTEVRMHKEKIDRAEILAYVLQKFMAKPFALAICDKRQLADFLCRLTLLVQHDDSPRADRVRAYVEHVEVELYELAQVGGKVE